MTFLHVSTDGEHPAALCTAVGVQICAPMKLLRWPLWPHASTPKNKLNKAGYLCPWRQAHSCSQKHCISNSREGGTQGLMESEMAFSKGHQSWWPTRAGLGGTAGFDSTGDSQGWVMGPISKARKGDAEWFWPHDLWGQVKALLASSMEWWQPQADSMVTGAPRGLEQLACSLAWSGC